MGDTENLQQKLEEILTGYNTTLENCVKKVSENNKLNQEVVDGIQNTIVKIKERVLQARNNVEEIGKQQTLFSNTMKQEQEKILNEQKERDAKSNEEKQELENKLKDAQSASNTKLQELEDKQKQKIQDLKEQARLDTEEEIRQQKEKDDAERERQVKELNDKMDNSNRVAAENASRIQKEAEEAKIKADNERAIQEQKLQEIEEKRQEIMKKDTACEEQLKLLNGNITEMKQEMENMKGDIETLTTQNSEDKKAAAETLKTQLAELALAHKGEMEAQIKTAAEDKTKYMEETAATQAEAIRKALEGANETNLRHQEEMKRATEETKRNLETQLEQCKQSKKAYEKEVNDHMEKYKVLEKQFENSKNDALDGLKELVDDLGEREIADLEKKIKEILGSKKGPGGTGTDESGSSLGIRRQNSVGENARVIARLDANKHQFEKQMSRLEDPDEQAIEKRKQAIEKRMEELKEEEDIRMKKQREDEARLKKIAEGKPPGNPKEAWGDKNPSIQELKKMVSDASKPAHHDIFFKKDGRLQKNDKIEADLHAPIDEYIDNHTPQELHLKILENRGFVNDSLKRPIKTSMKEVDWERRHDINGAFKRILKNIIKTHSILINGVVEAVKKGQELENIFEDLLTAFYIIHSSRQIHSFLIDNKKYDDAVLQEGGKHAGHLWAGGEGYLGEYEREIDKDEKSQYRIYIKNNDSTMNGLFENRPSGLAVKAHTSWKTMRQFGGFRHGKGSQKKNKRTLKSKLTAKKYSLKVGKKKKGKRGNKSQKRRKSIKIRI